MLARMASHLLDQAGGQLCMMGRVSGYWCDLASLLRQPIGLWLTWASHHLRHRHRGARRRNAGDMRSGYLHWEGPLPVRSRCRRRVSEHAVHRCLQATLPACHVTVMVVGRALMQLVVHVDGYRECKSS